MVKKKLPINERKIKALEEYLGLVFKDDDEYPEYVMDEYSTLRTTKDEIKKLNDKVFPTEKKKNRFWN